MASDWLTAQSHTNFVLMKTGFHENFFRHDLPHNASIGIHGYIAYNVKTEIAVR